MKFMYSFAQCVLLALCGFTAIILAAWYFHEKLIFSPSTQLASTPEAMHLQYEDVHITTPDGTIIHGWHIPADEGLLAHKNLTMLHFHGNAGNISHRLDYIKIFHELGLNTFIIDYHGYGRSGGKPSVKGTEEDALAAWDWLITEKGVPAEKIVLHGHSLGGGVAGWLAGQVQPAGLILEGTFTSLADAGKVFYPFLPVKMVLKDVYNTRKNLCGKDIPALFAHSPEDEIIPYSLGRELYESYTGPKTFLKLAGSHNEACLFSGEIYIDGLKQFLLRLK
jgi:fermentation-respiration switch protein FrsA (DUF1100 family)